MNEQQEHIVSGIVENYDQTQREIYAIEVGKLAVKLFSMAAIVFVSDLLGLVILRSVNGASLLIILVVPVLLTALGFLCRKEPLLSMILCALAFVGVWGYSFYMVGGAFLFKGWLIKALLIYMIFAGFQNATVAQRIRKEQG